MSAWADYVEWSGLDKSRLAHPAGKGVPESPEVVQARQDDEAIQLANSGRPRQAPEWAAVAALIVFGWLMLCGVSVAAALAEGWPW